MALDPWLVAHLVCPVDRSPLRLDSPFLVSAAGRRYPVIDDVPYLVSDAIPSLMAPDHLATTHELLARARRGEPVTLASLGPGTVPVAGEIDPYVQRKIAGTCGQVYVGAIGKLRRYPIPTLSLEEGRGRRLLDVGSNWGRWSVAAAHRGYRPVAMDPDLHALLASREVARGCGVSFLQVCADARAIPFAEDSFDGAYSYSVLQHFPKEDVAATLGEVRRVLKPGGFFRTQMLTRYGLRTLYNQARFAMAGRRSTGFDARWWSVPELRRTFGSVFGRAAISVDRFFTQGRLEDVDLIPLGPRAVVYLSAAITALLRPAPGASYVCDNVWVDCVKPADSGRQPQKTRKPPA